jgi:hypothetical protein
VTVLIPFDEAYDDPQLLGPHPKSFDRWRTAARVMDGLPLTEEQFDLFQRCTGRTVAPTVPASEVWIIARRRDGKTRFIGTRMAWAATCIDYRPLLAPGEWAVIPCVAADRRQGKVLFDYILGKLEGSPVLRQLITNQTRETIELGERRLRVEVRPPNYRTLRAPTYVKGGFDETGIWHSDDSSSPDTEVRTAVLAGMATIPTAQLLAVGTPFAKCGEQYRTHQRYWGQDDPRVLVWWARGPELAFNPTVSDHVIQDAFDRDPAAARSEWGAEYRDDLESFVSVDAFTPCIMSGRGELPPSFDVSYTAALDQAGGSGADSFTWCVGHSAADQTIVIDQIGEIRPPFSPDAACQQLAAAVRPYRVGAVTSDRYAAEWVATRLRANSLQQWPAPFNRSEAYIAALPWITGGRVQFPDPDGPAAGAEVHHAVYQPSAPRRGIRKGLSRSSPWRTR